MSPCRNQQCLVNYIVFHLEVAQTTLSTGATVGITAVVTGMHCCTCHWSLECGSCVPYHCISKYRSQIPKQEQQTGPVYEEVPASTARMKIELRENVAYGPASGQQ